MTSRVLIAYALTLVLTACGSTTATPVSPSTTSTPGATTTSPMSSTVGTSTVPTTSGAWSSSGYGVEVALRSCATAGSTPPSCDRVELQNLLSVLKASPNDVVYVHLCWGNPPRNYEDIEARNVVIGPIVMSLSEALAVAKSDRDVISVNSVSLPFQNPKCSVP